MTVSTRQAIFGSLAAIAGLAFLAFTIPAQLLVNLTVTGFAFGGIFALSGLGLVLTYKATGIFNFAHGAVAMIVAYVFWQLASPWGWPKWAAAALAVFVVAPAIGAVLEVTVFRRLQVTGAGTAEKLVRTLAVFIVLVGLAFVVWTGETKTDIPVLFPADRLSFGLPGTDLDVGIGIDQLAILSIVVVTSAVLYWLFNHTFLGTRIRATVDRRELAELAAINANRVSMIAWALGTAFAGLTGVLLATFNQSLDPIRFTLIVIETFAVAVLARLVSLPIAVGGGLFLGLLSTYASEFSFGTVADLLTGPDLAVNVANVLDPMLTSIAVFVLFGALVFYRNLDEPGGGGDRSFASSAQVGRLRRGRGRRAALGIGAAMAVLLPLAGFSPTEWPNVHEAVALAVVFVSIVAVTGFSGHITLGQAAFAGFGAFLTGRLHAGSFFDLPALPIIPAMIVAGLLCVPLGFAAGYPALRRRGLFLGLTTLALGLVMSRFVFENNFFVSGIGVIELGRPAGFDGDAAFYYFELGVLLLVLLLARNLRAGGLGRVLGAMRDSETATQSIGVSLRRYKLFIFSVSAFMAGIGGSLLGQSAQTFSHETYNPIISLLWFMIVVVAGVGGVSGAVLAAFLLTVINLTIDDPGAGQFLIGVLALLLPSGGLVGFVRRITGGSWAPRGLSDAYVGARRRRATTPAAPAPAAEGRGPSGFARRRMQASAFTRSTT